MSFRAGIRFGRAFVVRWGLVVAICAATVVAAGGVGSWSVVTRLHAIEVQEQIEAQTREAQLVALHKLAISWRAGMELASEVHQVDEATDTTLTSEQVVGLKLAESSLTEALTDAVPRLGPASVSDARTARIGAGETKVDIALESVRTALDGDGRAALTADPLADAGTRQTVLDKQAALAAAITARTKILPAITDLTVAIAAVNESQAQAVAAAAAAAAAAAQQASSSSQGSGGSRSVRGGSSSGTTSGGTSSGGASGGGSSSSGGAYSGPYLSCAGHVASGCDHTPRVIHPGNYVPGCNGSSAYSQSTGSGGTITIIVAYEYTYTTFSTIDGWGLEVYNCTP